MAMSNLFKRKEVVTTGYVCSKCGKDFVTNNAWLVDPCYCKPCYKLSFCLFTRASVCEGVVIGKELADRAFYVFHNSISDFGVEWYKKARDKVLAEVKAKEDKEIEKRKKKMNNYFKIKVEK